MIRLATFNNNDLFIRIVKHPKRGGSRGSIEEQSHINKKIVFDPAIRTIHIFELKLSEISFYLTTTDNEVYQDCKIRLRGVVCSFAQKIVKSY